MPSPIIPTQPHPNLTPTTFHTSTSEPTISSSSTTQTLLLPSLLEAPPDDYVIALHDYTAPNPSAQTQAQAQAQAQAHVYLSFRAGWKIRVFNRDESGWWDGEVAEMIGFGSGVEGGLGLGLGEEGRRGWFPSNFVEDANRSKRVRSRTDMRRRPSEASDSSYLSGTTSASSSSYDERPISSQQPWVHSHNDSYDAQSYSHGGQGYDSSAPTGLKRGFDHVRPRHAATVSEPVVTQLPYNTLAAGPNAWSMQDDTELEIDIVIEPINQAMALIHSAVQGRRLPHLQPSTACAISAIRSLLSATNCLSRDSPQLAQFPILGKIRKTILANLAELVALARSASQVGSPEGVGGVEGEDEMKEMELEGMVRSSRETLVNVREFLRGIIRLGIALPERKDADVLPIGGGVGEGDETISVRRQQINERQHGRGSSSPVQMQVQALGKEGGKREWQTPTAAGGMHKRERKASLHARSMGDLRLARKRHQEAVPPLPGVGAGGLNVNGRTVGPHGSQGGSISSVSSGVSSLDWPSRSSQDDAANQLVGDNSDLIASVKTTFECLQSVMAALIGHVECHTVSSHVSSHAFLMELSSEAVDKLKDLLVIIEAVIQHDPTALTFPREVTTLNATKDQMLEGARVMLEAVHRVAHTPYREYPTEQDDMNREKVNGSASMIMRPARECVRLVRICASGKKELSRLLASGSAHSSMKGSVDLGVPSQEDNDRASSKRSSRSSNRSGQSGTSSGHRKSLSIDTSRPDVYTPEPGMIMSAPLDRAFPSSRGGEEDEEEQEVIITSAEAAMQSRQTRPSLLSVKTSPFLPSTPHLPSAGSDTVTPSTARRRARAASFSSPSMTPRIAQQRSPHGPSRSVDMTTPTTANEFGYFKTPKAESEEFDRRPSMAETVVPDSAFSTPKAPRWWTGRNYQKESAPPLPDNQEEMRLAVSQDASRFEDAITPQRPERPTEVSASHMRMWLMAHDYGEKDISHNSEGGVSGATLPALIESLTPHDSPVDSALWETFFLTFRMFATPTQLLDAIELRYDLSPPPRMPLQADTIRVWNDRKVLPIRRRILALIKSWLETYWNTATDGEVLESLALFIEERLGRAFPPERARLLELVDKRRTSSSTTPVTFNMLKRSSLQGSITPNGMFHRPNFSMSSAATSLPPTPIMNKQLFNSLKTGATSSVHVTDFHALELARQLTLLESKLFCTIQPEQLIKTGKGRAESLRTMSTLSNRITGWVADSILDEVDAKKRTGLLKFFIKVANRCLELNNFSSMFAVLAGLNSSTILRLKKTWDGLPAKYRNLMAELRGIIEHTRNHHAYRTRLRTAEGPVLPFLGLILSDITFTSEGNPSLRPSPHDPSHKLINLDKYHKLSKIAIEFAQRYQQSFNLAVLPDVQNWLMVVLAERGGESLDGLHRKSLRLEPRQGSESISTTIPTWLGGRT